jgi:hypothetical protein
MAPRMYLALDAGFTSSAAIEQLGETHGAAGPMTIVSLLGLAKQQGEQGAVKTTRRKLAADAYLSGPEEAERIVAQALALGILEEIKTDERMIYVRFPRWGDWQKRAADADRQARWRRSQSLNGASSAKEDVAR